MRRNIFGHKNVPIFNFFFDIQVDDTNGVEYCCSWRRRWSQELLLPPNPPVDRSRLKAKGVKSARRLCVGLPVGHFEDPTRGSSHLAGSGDEIFGSTHFSSFWRNYFGYKKRWPLFQFRKLNYTDWCHRILKQSSGFDIRNCAFSLCLRPSFLG